VVPRKAKAFRPLEHDLIMFQEMRSFFVYHAVVPRLRNEGGLFIFNKEGKIIMDAKNCPDCGAELVDGLCPQCSAQKEKNVPAKGGAVANTGSGWGASVNRPFPSPKSAGGMFNG
jgi:hypothetical protein